MKDPEEVLKRLLSNFDVDPNWCPGRASTAEDFPYARVRNCA